MRFLGRVLTGLGFVVLGADGLATLETFNLAYYSLSSVGEVLASAMSRPVVQASVGSQSLLASLPLSLCLLWVGSILLAVFHKRT